MVRKALIPIAGLGKRMGPLARAVPKAMLPLVDAQGRARPVLHHVLAEAAAAGIESAAVVVAPDQTDMVRRYLTAALRAGWRDLPAQVEFVTQTSPLGLGDAVARGADFIGHDERGFLLLLGDHVHLAEAGGAPCAAQVAEAFDEAPSAAMIGVQVVGEEDLARVGVARGQPIGEGLYRCTGVVEKPDLAVARAGLTTPGLPEGRFLAHAGIYVLSSEIFECLARLQVADRPAGQEIQLTDAEAALLKSRPGEVRLVLVRGRTIDAGSPEGYARAFAAVRGA